jgi:putative transposase
VLVGDIAERLRELIGQKANELGMTVHALEVMPNHVHLFVEDDPTFAPAHIAAQFKGFPQLRSRLPTLWSRSYLIASVGYVTEKAVKRYIETLWERT